LLFVLHRSHVRIVISINLERSSVGIHLVAELCVNAFMDKDSLYGNANLLDSQYSWKLRK
jgi:hypothetical protein